MTDAPGSAPDRPRWHRSWILPLLAAPVIFVVSILISGAMLDADGRVWHLLAMIPTVIALLGPVAAIVLSIVNALWARKHPRRPGVFGRLSDADAASRGLTREEYGVYKGDVFVLNPGRLTVTSASGLLALSIALTAISVFVLVMIGILIAQDAGLLAKTPGDRVLTPVEWFFVAVSFIAPFAGWHLYRVERKAQKLRLSRGLPEDLRKQDRRNRAR
ncbi:hypothetical protein [Clavibacter sp. VKM Ac-2872]|uniref:hypothetical protein n=1 Tax=Clavibacter sp. VKM Ac-2872 TaxID=2783812 RepID=UPI00188ACB49|nr:hypothetical protein [Clavibacter sp. VKM Ac-2872]MBF4624934.1 hypothetical protein [Clavibacter sp. VKM Ac-2872]